MINSENSQRFILKVFSIYNEHKTHSVIIKDKFNLYISLSIPNFQFDFLLLAHQWDYCVMSITKLQ